MADRPAYHEPAHPTQLTYLKVAAALVVLTVVEVGVFYVDFLEPAFLSIFLTLSVLKFALVVLFYMHLKFDSRLFSGVFIGGLVLAIAVAVVLMALFQVLSAVANPNADGTIHVELEGGPESPSITEDEPSTTIVGCPAGDLVCQGQALFLSAPDNVAPQALWCSQCHTFGSVSAGLIGPDLTNLSTEASNRKLGLSAVEYVEESVRLPEAFICDVERCAAGLMTPSITEDLTDDQINALVAFLIEPR